MIKAVLFRHDKDQPEVVSLNTKEGLLSQIRTLIDCEMIENFYMSNDFQFYVDELGRFSDNADRPNRCVRRHFPDLKERVYGNALMIHDDDEDVRDISTEELLVVCKSFGKK